MKGQTLNQFWWWNCSPPIPVDNLKKEKNLEYNQSMEPVGEYDNTDVKIKTATFAFAYQETKHEYEFQEVCADLEPYYGKIVWSLAHRVGFTPHKMREAHKIAQKRGITSVGYFIGIIKKL